MRRWSRSSAWPTAITPTLGSALARSGCTVESAWPGSRAALRAGPLTAAERYRSFRTERGRLRVDPRARAEELDAGATAVGRGSSARRGSACSWQTRAPRLSCSLRSGRCCWWSGRRYAVVRHTGPGRSVAAARRREGTSRRLRPQGRGAATPSGVIQQRPFDRAGSRRPLLLCLPSQSCDARQAAIETSLRRSGLNPRSRGDPSRRCLIKLAGADATVWEV